MDHIYLGKNTKLLEDDIDKNLDKFGYSDDFLDITPKAQSMEEIIDKQTLLKF